MGGGYVEKPDEGREERVGKDGCGRGKGGRTREGRSERAMKA